MIIQTLVTYPTLDDILKLDLSNLEINTRYHGHPAFTAADHLSLLQHDIFSGLKAGGVCAIEARKGRISAVCSISPLVWDSALFEIPMMKMALAAEKGYPSDSIQRLVQAAIAKLPQQTPFAHISTELDIDQYNFLNALLTTGFEIMDIKREFRWTSLKRVTCPKLVTQVREAKNSDRATINRLLDNCSFESRFSRDPFIPQKKLRELYSRWLNNLLDLSDEGKGFALVFQKNGIIQGCGTIAEVDLGEAGIPLRLMDKGLYISSPEGTGGYYPVIYSLAARALALYDSVQTAVSLNNHSASRVLERMNGGTQSIRYSMRLVHPAHQRRLST